MQRIVGNRITLYFMLLFLFIPSSISIGQDFDPAGENYSFNKAESFLRINEYDSAIFHFESAANFYKSTGDSIFFLNSALKLVECYMIKAEFENCNSYIIEIEEYLGSANLQSSYFIAKYYYLRSKIYYSIDYFDSSNIYIEKALNISRKDKNQDSLRVLLLKAKGNNYFMTNDFDESLNQYQKALEIEQYRSSDSTIAMATLWGNIGLIYTRKGQYSNARNMYQISLGLKERLLDPLDPKLASAYNNLGRIKVTLGQYDEAITLFDKAENIYHKKFGTDNFNNALLYFNKGSAYINKKDFEKALSYHLKSIEIYKNYLEPTNQIFGKIYSNMGLIYRSLNEIETAIIYYRKSIELVTEPVSIPIGYRNLAHCFSSIALNDSAEIYFQTAINQSINLLGDNHFQTGTSYKAIGDYYLQMEDFENSHKYLLKALSIFSSHSVKNKRDLANLYLSIGSFYQNQDVYLDALKNYQLALITGSDNFLSGNYLDNPNLFDIDPDYNIVLSLKEKSRVLLKLFEKVTHDKADLKAGFESAKLGIALFEKIRSSLMTEDDKLFLTNDIFNLYELSVIAATKLYEVTSDKLYLEEAFKLAEKSKASILLSSIRELEASNFSIIPDSLRQLEKSLKKSISVTEHLLYEENSKPFPDADKLKTWNNDLFALQRKYEKLISKLENEYSDYYDLKYNFNVLSASEIKENIKDDVLIEYFHADSILFAFFINNDSIGYSKTAIKESYTNNVKAFIEVTHSPPSIENSGAGFESFTRVSNELYIDLIQPLERVIAGKSIIIVPDGLLGYAPFEALIISMPESSKADYRKLPYLINHNQIRYSYSASLLFKNQRIKRTRGKLLAFAPSYEEGLNPGQDSNSIASNVRNLLKPLDFNIGEVEGIKSIIGGDIHIGNAANVSTFLQNAEDYAILHLAMHALIDDEEPLASKLAFSSNYEEQQDGFLNAFEIYNMNLNAQMVVLSACQTGAGNLSRGEGIMSMARGFFYAGVPGIVMTLWEIEDESSLRIMVDFYDNINESKTKDEALQLAKQNYFQSSTQLFAHPYYWAAYVQIGNNSSISFHSVYSQRIFLASAMMIFVIAMVLMKRRKSSKKNT